MKLTFNTCPDSFETHTIDLPLNISAIDTANIQTGDFVKVPYTDEEFTKQFHSLICVGDYGDGYVGPAIYYDYEKGENVSVPSYEYDKSQTDTSFYISYEYGSDEPFITMCVSFNDEKMHEYEETFDAPRVIFTESELKQLMCLVVMTLNDIVCGVA